MTENTTRRARRRPGDSTAARSRLSLRLLWLGSALMVAACGGLGDGDGSEVSFGFGGAREGRLEAAGEPKIENRRPAFGSFAFATLHEDGRVVLRAFAGAEAPRGDLLVVDLGRTPSGVLSFQRSCDAVSQGCAEGRVYFGVDVAHVLDELAASEDAGAAFSFISGEARLTRSDAAGVGGTFEAEAEDVASPGSLLTVTSGEFGAPALDAAAIGEHWSRFEPGDGHTWVYQGYDGDDEPFDGLSLAHSFGYHQVAELGRTVLYEQIWTATDAAAGSSEPFVWVPDETMRAWGFGREGALEVLGHVSQSHAAFVAYEEPIVVLPPGRPSVGDTWDVVVDERPVFGGGQQSETVISHRRLVATGVTVEAPLGTFTDCYQVAIEHLADSEDSIDRYEYWSPSIGDQVGGGLVAVQSCPGTPLARWHRLARVAEGGGWHVPFRVVE